MNPLLILLGIVIISAVLKPATLNRSVDSPTYSRLANKSTVELSTSNTNVIKTPLVVFELSDRTAWQEDSEVVSQKATQILVVALFRRGLCFHNWAKRSRKIY